MRAPGLMGKSLWIDSTRYRESILVNDSPKKLSFNESRTLSPSRSVVGPTPVRWKTPHSMQAHEVERPSIEISAIWRHRRREGARSAIFVTSPCTVTIVPRTCSANVQEEKYERTPRTTSANRDPKTRTIVEIPPRLITTNPREVTANNVTNVMNTSAVANGDAWMEFPR
jgi:hypothetical protein